MSLYGAGTEVSTENDWNNNLQTLSCAASHHKMKLQIILCSEEPQRKQSEDNKQGTFDILIKNLAVTSCKLKNVG